MTTTTDTEPITGDVVPYVPQTGVLEAYRPQIVMSPDEAKALDDQLRACMKAILKEGVDYGPIPGGDPNKKNLNKPGAEKLLQWFGFGSESQEIKTERDDPDYPSGLADRARRIGVTYRTEVSKTVPGGGKIIVATCEGYAGYDEDRYYSSAEDAAAKAEAKERFWAQKDKREPNPAKWAHTAEYRAPWNTLIKMAQKRSYVGAAIDATGAAGLFTQDMEDATPAAATAGDVATAGRAAIAALPANVGQALDEWYTTLNWPGPDVWNADQWCKALVKAGKLAEAYSRKGEPPAARQEPPAAERAPATQAASPSEQPSTEGPPGEDWLTEHEQKALSFKTENDGRKLWRTVTDRARDRLITREQAQRLHQLIESRIADQRDEAAKAVQGTVVSPLDPADEWAAKVETIEGDVDAEAARADVETGRKAGHIADDRAVAILAAIDIRVASLAKQAA